MKGFTKWALYLFAAYNAIVGAIAVFMPKLLPPLYAVDTFSPEASMTSRWLGALAIAMAYAAIVYIRTANKEIARVLIVGAIATIAASVIGVIIGEASVSNIWFDFLFQAILVTAVMASGKS